MDLTLESLGLSKDDITERLLDRLVENFTTEPTWDEDGAEGRRRSTMADQIAAQVKAHIDATVTRLADEHVLPRVTEIIEGLTLQKTNQWGEKTGQSVTFIEYLTQRADAYMREEVSFDGKTKAESGGYSWSKATTRIAYMVDKHLQYSIQKAMETALKDANSAIVGGIAEAVKIKLAEVQKSLKVSVATK